PLPSTTTSYSSGCDTCFPPRVNSTRSFPALATTISITTRNSGRTSRETTRSINGPRGAGVTLTRELRFLPSSWAFARDVDYCVFQGREQQINRFPAAAGPSGSGSYFTDPDINPHA